MRNPSSLTRGWLGSASLRWAVWYSRGSSISDGPHRLHRLARLGNEAEASDDGEEAVSERGPRRPRFEIVPVELLPKGSGVLEHRSVVEVVLGQGRELRQ